jgi:hypothetical protein
VINFIICRLITLSRTACRLSWFAVLLRFSGGETRRLRTAKPSGQPRRENRCLGSLPWSGFLTVDYRSDSNRKNVTERLIDNFKSIAMGYFENLLRC